MDTLYDQLGDALAIGRADPLAIDLSRLSFVRPNELLVLVTVARLWHRHIGQHTTLVGMQPEVHRYLERMDLFTTCGDWLQQDHELPLAERYARSRASRNLLEVVPIAADNDQNSRDVTDTTGRAKDILETWFGAKTPAVGRLLTILSEIASNVAHSDDRGFAVIQRYRNPADPAAGGRVVVAVADLGIGIEASLRRRRAWGGPGGRRALGTGSGAILRAFDLGVSSRETVAGLGLPRVRQIVGEWHGLLAVRSFGSSVRFEEDAVYTQDGLAEVPGTQVTITAQDLG